MLKILQKILGLLAKKIIEKYHPTVIAITGSIGKTSTKEAVFSVLNSKFVVRQNVKNYNNEIGVPLTVIGTESGGKSLLSWSKIIFKAISLILFYDNNYPKVLVLEMGADHPGDIEYLIKIVPDDIGVVTKVAPVHLEYFKTIDKIAKEKSRVITELSKDDVAILNYDDELVKTMSKNTKAKIISYGYGDEADVRAIDIENQGEGLQLRGLQFKLAYQGSTVPMLLPNVLGAHQVYAAMAAAAVGIALGMNLIEVSQGLRKYTSPKGRMNLIKGKNNSLIIDDTYNSSPQAANAAIESIAKLKIKQANQKIAILGDMLELGEISDQAHYNLGKKVADSGFNLGIFVGKFKDQMAKGANDAGLNNVLTFKTSLEAAEKLKDGVDKNDILLVKGSQGVRMEKIVKALMAQPKTAKDLLVRQHGDWLNS